MQALIQEYLPNAPQLGLYVRPDLPERLLRNALSDYARTMQAEDVCALFDATLMGSAKDGVAFGRDRLVYQNHDLQPAQTIRYDDIVGVDVKRKLLGGREIRVDVNSGRATVTHTLDFSGKPEASDYVARLLQEIMMASVERLPSAAAAPSTTDTGAVQDALLGLVDSGRLSEDDYAALMDVLLRRQKGH